MANAAIWLYKATNTASYLSDAQNFYAGGLPWAFSWNDARAGVAVGYKFQILQIFSHGYSLYRGFIFLSYLYLFD